MTLPRDAEGNSVKEGFYVNRRPDFWEGDLFRHVIRKGDKLEVAVLGGSAGNPPSELRGHEPLENYSHPSDPSFGFDNYHAITREDFLEYIERCKTEARNLQNWLNSLGIN